jgi:hypothetical protein
VARNTITLPIIKSSNDFGYTRLTDASYQTGDIYTSPKAISNTLVVTHRYNNAKARFGVAWDASLIPKGKNILNVTLYYYTIDGHSDPIYFRYTDFSEGATLPNHEPTDGSKMGGASYGWGTLDLGVAKGNSVVIYAELGTKTIYVYDDKGVLVGMPVVGEKWEIYSHRSPVNQPYVVVTYGDVPPEPPTSLYPVGIMVSTRDGIKFAWSHSSQVNQKSFELQYSLDSGATWTTINQTTSNQFYDMPANTLPETGSVTWRVRTTDINDETSGYTTANFTLGIPPQKAPIPVAPIAQYISETAGTWFEWIFTGGSANDTQSKADLQYSADNGSTWTTKTQTSENTYMTLPPNTFKKGNITWRVRTYNNWNEVSPWSENKTFTVIGTPAVPLITSVSNKARPVIKWQTQEQQVYELEILRDDTVIYDTGSMPSATDREHTVAAYLENGDYIVRIRIANEYSLYSSWAEKRFTISTPKPAKPSISIYNGVSGVTLKTDSKLKSIVYRNGEPVGEMVGGTFTDYTGESEREYRYFIRVIDAGDNFADSIIKSGKCRLIYNTIAPFNNPGEYIKLKYGLDADPVKNGEFTVSATLNYFDGRTYPVPEYSEYRKMEKSLSFYLESRSEVERLRSLIDSSNALIYRDTDGEVIIGCVLSVNYSKNALGYIVTFAITRTV